MIIQRSSAAQIALLLRDLLNGSAVQRAAAAARLVIAGERAEGPLLKALGQASPRDKATILHVLERLERPRVLAGALGCLGDADATVAMAAVSAVRPHLRSGDPEAAAHALDALMAACLDVTRAEEVRLAAIEALGDLGDAGLALLRARLRDDSSERIRLAAGVEGHPEPGVRAATARLETLAQQPGQDPVAIRELIGDAGTRVSLSTLHTLVLRLAERERSAARPADAADWNAALAAAHRALAERGSRLAVFELRDSLERTPPERLDDLLVAAAAVGDSTCLIPLAAAYTRSPAGVRDRVAWAFRMILQREGLTRRHAAVRRALDHFPDAGRMLA